MIKLTQEQIRMIEDAMTIIQEGGDYGRYFEVDGHGYGIVDTDHYWRFDSMRIKQTKLIEMEELYHNKCLELNKLKSNIKAEICKTLKDRFKIN